MRYFLDTEFIEDGKTIDLISIGIVAEDGRKLYLQNQECDFTQASEWVRENVFRGLIGFNTDHLQPVGCEHWRTRSEIAAHVKGFCEPERYGKPEFWGYYADYDWVVFCQLFGRMIDLPKGFPMYCRDIKQLCDDLGNPEMPKQEGLEHHALADALWNKVAWESLRSNKQAVRA